MTRKLTFHLITILCILFAVPVSAQTYSQDFEAADASYFQQPVQGAACKGSAVDLSQARAHSGRQSAHLAYRFSGRGSINLSSTAFPIIVREGTTLHLSLWVYGSGLNDFPGGGGFMLVDAGNETFQYWLGKPWGDALGGAGWTQLNADIDLTKPAGHWGGKNTGVIQRPLRLLGLSLDHTPNLSAQGELFIDDLTVIAGKEITQNEAPGNIPAVPSAVSLALKAEWTKAGFVPIGRPVIVDIASSSLPPALAGRKVRADWSAVDFQGVKTAQGSTLLDSHGNGRFSVTPHASGILYIHASLALPNGAAVAIGETQIAAYSAADSTPASSAAEPSTNLPLLFGIVTHMEGLSDVDAEREAGWMSALGFRAARIGDIWNSIEPKKGVWNWKACDRDVALLNQNKIETQWLLAYTARWASTGDQSSSDESVWQNAPPNIGSFTEYARECVLRYKSSIRYWEVWNEPDNGFWRGTPEQYAQLFDATYAAIKSADPAAVVLNGGISEVGHGDFVPRWQAAVHTKPDIFAYHSHASATGMVQANAAIQADLAAAHWTMPVWINEAGFSTAGASTERDQAITMAEKMSSAAALGNKAYFWYDLLNDGEDPANTEYNFGLLRSDFSPKASAVAMRTLIDTLSHNRFIRRIPIYDAPHVSFLLFGAPDGRSGVMILWNEAKTSVPFLMSVPGKANRISLMGNVRTLCSSPGLIALTASDEPQFVRFSGSVDQVKTIPSPVALPKQVIVASSEETTVVIKASNPLTRTIKGILTLSVPRGWRIKPSVFTLTIPVGGHKELPFTLKAPPKPLLRENLNFRFTASALPSELQASVALSCAVLIPRTATDPQRLGDSQNWRNPIISFGQANIISLYQNAPLDNMLFHGNNDLSARVFISRVPAGLRLSIHVHDDIFFQNEPAGAEWQGDSIQFAISPPTGENYAWTAALTAKGPVAELDIAPRGVALGQTALQLAIRRDEDAHETLYDLIVPARLPGGAPLGDRFLMTLLVNDNDGRGRKGWAEWTPGIGRSKDPTQYQPIEIR